MRFFSVVFIILVLGSLCAAQKIDNLERLDDKTFEQQLEKLPSLISKTRWEFFYRKAVDAFENEEYETSRQLISKSRIIAEKLEENFLIGKSLRFAGKVETKLFQLSKASRFFEKASAFLEQAGDSADLKLEVGFLLNDWANRFTNPNLIHDDIDLREAQKLLSFALKITENPNIQNPELKILTILNVANCFGIKGNYLTQVYWLEKAKSEIKNNLSAAKYNSELFSSLIEAYLKLGDMAKVNYYLKSLESETKGKKTPRLIYLRKSVEFYTKINSNLRYQSLDEGIRLAKQFKDFNYLSEFYRQKMLTLLIDRRLDEAKEYINLLEELSKSGNYIVEELDIFTVKAVIEGLTGNQEKSDELFIAAEKILADEGNDWSNALFLYNWEAKTANYQKRFSRLKELCENYLKRIKSSNRQDFLPQIYFYLANAEFGLGNSEAARIANQNAIELIETRRLSNSAIVSTGTIDKLFDAYQQRILFELAENKVEEGFNAAELLKSRWLTDKILKKDFSQDSLITEDLGKQIEGLARAILENPDDQNQLTQLLKLERNVLLSAKNQNSSSILVKTSKNSLQNLENLNLESETAIISYVFTSDQKLNAFVVKSDKTLRKYEVNLNVTDAEKLAKNVQNQIKNGVFFKERAKEVYDILLKPLNLKNISHLIIIPDKSLWKIPFQVLSAEGKKFLIEDHQITYAPSATILSNFLAFPKPKRETFQVFANARFDNYYLLYADQEAKSLAQFYRIKPFLNSTIEQFTARANQSDILHFSMHAEVDEKEPFNSFLAFNKSIPNPSGKLKVNELINIKLKNQSLAFLASCATDNVLNGEGLVSLAWGMMNAGATTVVSAQWEANDESTEQFTQRFYKYYKQGFSGAESLQKASIEMINSPNSRLNKPYNWAEFTLNGDFR